MKLRNILIGCGIVLVIVCIGGAAVVYFCGKTVVDAFAAPITANNDFMNALIAKDYAKAYGLVSPSQQTAFGGSADGMKQLISSKQWEPSSYTFSNIQLTSGALINGTGSFGGTTKYVYIALQKERDTWKVAQLDVNDNAPTATAPAK